MHIITRKRLNDFAKMHPDCAASLVQWFNEMRRTNFSNIQEVRAVFPHADKVGKFTVFNIGGNKARLIAAIHYNWKKVYICCRRFKSELRRFKSGKLDFARNNH